MSFRTNIIPSLPKRMIFWKNSKRPLTRPPPFSENYVANFYNGCVIRITKSKCIEDIRDWKSFGPSWQTWQSTSLCCHPCSSWPIRYFSWDLHPWNWALVTRKVKLSCHLGDPVHHLLLLDVAHDHIVNHFLGLTQQTPVTRRIMAVFALSLVCVDDDLYIMMKCLSVCL